MKYNQLTLVKRYQILTLLKERYNQKEIALKLLVHPSTICRELKPFKGKEYNPEEAHIQVKLKHIKKPKRQALNKQKEKYIRAKIKEDWSPQQI